MAHWASVTYGVLTKEKMPDYLKYPACPVFHKVQLLLRNESVKR